MGIPNCDCIPPNGELSDKWIRECEHHKMMREELEKLREICSHAGIFRAQEKHNALVNAVEKYGFPDGTSAGDDIANALKLQT